MDFQKQKAAQAK